MSVDVRHREAAAGVSPDVLSHGGLGLVGPTCNFGFLSDFSKLVLTLTMLLGRLEIMPLLVLMMPSVWRRK